MNTSSSDSTCPFGGAMKPVGENGGLPPQAIHEISEPGDMPRGQRSRSRPRTQAAPALTEGALAEKLRSLGAYGGLAAELMPFIAQHAAPAASALTHAELLELQRAAADFEDGCDTDVDHDLLARGAMAGYFHCNQFYVLDGEALERDAAMALQQQGGAA